MIASRSGIQYLSVYQAIADCRLMGGAIRVRKTLAWPQAAILRLTANPNFAHKPNK